METMTTYGVGPDQPTYAQLREQNRVLASKADNLGRVLAIAIIALRYYAKTAISARAVEAMEKMAKLQVFSCFYCSQDHLWLAAQDGWHATKKEGIKVRCEAKAAMTPAGGGKKQ